jgi:hypothetical protein
MMEHEEEEGGAVDWLRIRSAALASADHDHSRITYRAGRVCHVQMGGCGVRNAGAPTSAREAASVHGHRPMTASKQMARNAGLLAVAGISSRRAPTAVQRCKPAILDARRDPVRAHLLFPPPPRARHGRGHDAGCLAARARPRRGVDALRLLRRVHVRPRRYRARRQAVHPTHRTDSTAARRSRRLSIIACARGTAGG